jgi:hypothetical protein
MPTETLGLAFDGRNHLYVLESSFSTTDRPRSRTGDRPSNSHTAEWQAGGPDRQHGLLVVPTGITFGPDGALYISNVGYGARVGAGQIIKVELIE